LTAALGKVAEKQGEKRGRKPRGGRGFNEEAKNRKKRFLEVKNPMIVLQLTEDSLKEKRVARGERGGGKKKNPAILGVGPITRGEAARHSNVALPVLG